MPKKRQALSDLSNKESSKDDKSSKRDISAIGAADEQCRRQESKRVKRSEIVKGSYDYVSKICPLFVDHLEQALENYDGIYRKSSLDAKSKLITQIIFLCFLYG